MLSNLEDIHEGNRYRIKDWEKAAIFQCICSREEITRKKIAKKLNIRATAVSNVVQELIDDNLVLEGRARNPGKKGRPEIRLYPHFNRFQAIALHVVSRELKGFLINMGEEILAELTMPLAGSSGNSVLLQSMQKLISSLTSEKPASSELLGIGLSLPGTVSPKTKKWISAARWPNIRHLSLSSIEKSTGFKISLHRFLDAELEHMLLKNPRYREGGTLLLHWGYGIGSAYAHQGTVLKSTLGRFGEIGHSPVNTQDPKQCLCGSKGCLETEAALWALLPEIKKNFPLAPEDEFEFTDFIKHRNIKKLPVIKRALDYVAIELTKLHKIFYPDRIIISGPFTRDETIFRLLAQGFMSNIASYAKDSVSLEALSAGFPGGVFGSTYVFFHKALKDYLTARWSGKTSTAM